MGVKALILVVNQSSSKPLIVDKMSAPSDSGLAA